MIGIVGLAVVVFATLYAQSLPAQAQVQQADARRWSAVLPYENAWNESSKVWYQQTADGPCVINWREVQQWRLPMALIPSQCLLRFRIPTLWEAHSALVVVTVVALMLQSALILALWHQRRRRAFAEAEARHRRDEMTHAARLAMVGEITASIAHEVAQPLSAILSNADCAELLLDRHEPDLREIRQILADIRRDDMRAHGVVLHLRTLLRKGELHIERVDLSQTAAAALALIGPDAARRNVMVRSALDPHLPAAAGDPVHLQQVMLNLMMNAMDSMVDTSRESRVLEVRTSRFDERSVGVTIRDNGHGIAPELLPRLFDSFVTTKRHGMGLGLSVARTIVQAHRGVIWAENLAGGGAVFRFTLPVST